MEVILVGRDVTPAEVAEIAVEEDVDVIGISILVGNYRYLLPECVRQLRERGKGDALVISGGTIDERDYPFLKEAGIAEIWGPGTPTSEIVKFIEEYLAKKGKQES